MIPQNKRQWQKSLSDCITEPEKLLKVLELDQALLPAAVEAAKHFPLRVPLEFVKRIKKGDIQDPLLKQVLPIGEELKVVEKYSADPVNESQYNPVPGLLHKYQGRVLLTLAGSCAINCRYCFRRDFPYEQNNPGKQGWQQALDYIQQDDTIHEVILSGGDPLIVNDKGLNDLVNHLEQIAHLKRLRIHTRLPIVIPSRITEEFINIMTDTTFQTVIVVHCNHANEVDAEVEAMFKKLNQANIPLFNQAVLLKGVNDNLQALTDLSESLFENKVIPYYLHLLDKVQGAHHFDMPRDAAIELYQQLKNSMPGYLVPRLVEEKPGQGSKFYYP